PRPLQGGEQAVVGVLSVPLLGGVRGGFLVLMLQHKTEEVRHEVLQIPRAGERLPCDRPQGRALPTHRGANPRDLSSKLRRGFGRHFARAVALRAGEVCPAYIQSRRQRSGKEWKWSA